MHEGRAAARQRMDRTPPTVSSWQVDEQPSPSTVLPSSHCSLQSLSTVPLPHGLPTLTQTPP
jgi:hypothetical protein